MEGREIIMENLREHCLFEMESDDQNKDFQKKMHKSGKAVYFEYMKRVHSECKSRIDETCSKRVMDSQHIDFEYVK